MSHEIDISEITLDQIETLANTFSEYLKPGDLIVSVGDIGSGKNYFAKGIARGLGVKETIKSPTFSLLNIHKGRLPLYHFDLNTIESPEQLEKTGYQRYLRDDGVVIVEWGYKIESLLPDDHLTVKFYFYAKKPYTELSFFSKGPYNRSLHISASGKRSGELVEKIEKLWRDFQRDMAA